MKRLERPKRRRSRSRLFEATVTRSPINPRRKRGNASSPTTLAREKPAMERIRPSLVGDDFCPRPACSRSRERSPSNMRRRERTPSLSPSPRGTTSYRSPTRRRSTSRRPWTPRGRTLSPRASLTPPRSAKGLRGSRSETEERRAMNVMERVMGLAEDVDNMYEVVRGLEKSKINKRNLSGDFSTRLGIFSNDKNIQEWMKLSRRPRDRTSARRD